MNEKLNVNNTPDRINNTSPITEYSPEYCRLLYDYAYNYFDIDGFYGEYNISPVAAARWELEYDDWREAIMMAEYRKKAGIAANMRKLLEYSRGFQVKNPKTGKLETLREPDIDLMQKVLFKMSDNNLRIEKDSGNLKRRGLENARKAKTQTTTDIDNDMAVKIANELLKNKE